MNPSKTSTKTGGSCSGVVFPRSVQAVINDVQNKVLNGLLMKTIKPIGVKSYLFPVPLQLQCEDVIP